MVKNCEVSWLTAVRRMHMNGSECARSNKSVPSGAYVCDGWNR
jgi:hypothetical protein